MTTMLEKAARAVGEAVGYRGDDILDKDSLAFDIARAVLMAVRDVAEPVSWRALERLDGDACCFEFTYTRSREIHTAMIDAILEGGA